jgi:hypothetical protein
MATSAGFVQLSPLMTELLSRYDEQIRQHTARLIEKYAKLAEDIAATARVRHQTFIDQIARSLETRMAPLAAEARITVLSLAQRGWYLDPKLTMRQTMYVLEVYSRGAHRKAEQLLSRYYEKHLSTIEREVCNMSPSRAKILRAAFWAHRRKKYGLSVPILLMQADGMCLDVLNTQLFQRRSGRPATAEALGALSAPTLAFLAPLMEPVPITASRQERTTLPPGEINRHAIIHGESVTYGTRVNSFKAISLLRYLAWMLPSPNGLKIRN